MSTMTKRLSLTLERDDEIAVEPFTHEGTPERATLTLLVDATVLPSDAAVLRALIRLGAESVRERLLDEGYAALAAAMTDEDRAEQRAIRDHQARRRAERGARD